MMASVMATQSYDSSKNNLKMSFGDEALNQEQTASKVVEQSVADGDDGEDEEEEVIVFKPRNKRASQQNVSAPSSNRNSWANGQSKETPKEQQKPQVTLTEPPSSPESAHTASNDDARSNVSASQRTNSSSLSDTPQPTKHLPKEKQGSWRNSSSGPNSNAGSKNGSRRNSRPITRPGSRPNSRPSSNAPVQNFPSGKPPVGPRNKSPIPTGLMDPDAFGRAARARGFPDVDYVLKSGAPRSAARGRGKLWVP